MPKSAQEWKDELSLPELPDAEYLAALNRLEGLEAVDGGRLEAQGLAKAMTPGEVAGSVLLNSVGELLRAVRLTHQMTVREAGAAWGVSPGRISQIESAGANLYSSTLGEMAHRMGYRVRVILEPLDPEDPARPRFETVLPHD
jgi:hypothetical protein